MQLKKPATPLRLGLMAASCALLGAPTANAQTAPDGEQPLLIDTGLLYYKEDQGRVRTIEPVVRFKKDYGDEHVLGVTLAYDSLTGGSPNGAIPSRKAQTFATPSGTSLQPVSGVPQTYTTPSGQVVAALAKITLYTVQPGQLPLDPNFHDRRIAADVSWAQPVGTNTHASIGGHLSNELDFDSAALSAALSRDFNGKNTTVSAGFNAEFDAIKPIGGAPVGGTDYTQLLKGGNKTKNVVGGLLGLTQVMSRRWISQLNYTYDKSNGYLTDPYKILSIVDGTGTEIGYRFENRPGSRVRQSLYFGNKAYLGGEVLDLSYRRGKDDWGIKSDTIDGRLRIDLGNDIYLEPHARWYHQGAADFYHLYLNQADPLPTYLSADPRLADFKATTFGLKVGIGFGGNNELSLRIEQYQQKPTDTSSSLAGLQGLNLNPGLKTAVVQLGWRYDY
jgi:hypothetical protein